MNHDVRPDFDDIDRQLIGHLVEDGRATFAALAPLVGLSQAAVRTRVQRLLDDDVIAVTGRVDPASLGLGVFAFGFLEVSGELDKMASRLSEIAEVVFIVLASGRFDLMIELRCTDEDRLLDALDAIRTTEGVRRLQTATVLHYDKQDWTSVGRPDAHLSRAPEPVTGRVLDDIDRRLVIELLADGRATYAALAPLVGLSQAAVRDRVMDLLERRIVTIQAHPVPGAMGIGGFAGLALKAAGPVRPIVEAMAARPETCVVVRTLGRFDVLAEVWFQDRDHLASLLEDLRTVAGVASIDTVPYHRIAHEGFDTGLRR